MKLRYIKDLIQKSKNNITIATRNSGSRLERLNEIKTQTLVINGVEDPLTSISCAKKYLKFYLNAKKYYIHTMGHDLSKPILKLVIKKYAIFCQPNDSNEIESST